MAHYHRIRSLFRCVCIVLLQLVTGCGRSPEPDHLLLVTLDTVRADGLGCYGNAGARTPVLDRLATRGALFEQAFTTCPLTLPSHASMLTGRLPFEHGVRNNDQKWRQNFESVAEILSANGFTTAAVVSAFVLDRRFGLSRGFDTYVDRLEPDQNQRPGGETTTIALDLLNRSHPEDRLFLWVHYFDAHGPHTPRPPFQEDSYSREITFVDQQVGTLLAELEALGIRDRSTVVVVGDHGEAFGEHEERLHGYYLYEPTLHVPLIISSPGSVRATVRSPVSVADVAPTLLTAAGVDSPQSPFATDLGATARAGGDAERGVYSETLSPYYNYRASPLAALRTQSLKYIETPIPELYDLRSDPTESRNLADLQPARVASLRTRLEQMHSLDEFRRLDASEPAPEPIDAAATERLRALGYAASTSDNTLYSFLPDAKTMMPAIRAIRRGDRAADQGDTSGAMGAYREALTIDPSNWKATWKLATLLEQANQKDAAVNLYRDLTGRQPTNVAAWRNLVSALLRNQRAPEALPILERLGLRNPGSSRFGYLHGLALLQTGRRQDARAKWEKTLRQDPRNEEVRRALSALLLNDRP